MSGFRGTLNTSPGGGSSLTDPVTVAHGGTGATTSIAAFAALAAMTLGQECTFALTDNIQNTAPIARVLKHLSSGTTAANFGVGDAVDLQSAAGNLRRVMTDVTSLITATDTAEEAKRVIQLMSAGTVVDALDIRAGQLLVRDGTAPLPSVAFAGATTMGLYRDAANSGIAWSVAGIESGYLKSTGISLLSNAAGIALLDSSIARNVSTGSLDISGPIQGIKFLNRINTKRGASVASATTITLGLDGNVIPITGATNVQGIVTTGMQSGVQVLLELPSGITIVHNSGAPGAGAVAIQLKAAANLTTSRVTFLPLCYNGTFWYEVG